MFYLVLALIASAICYTYLGLSNTQEDDIMRRIENRIRKECKNENEFKEAMIMAKRIFKEEYNSVIKK